MDVLTRKGRAPEPIAAVSVSLVNSVRAGWLIDLARHYFGPQGRGVRQERLEENAEEHDPPDSEQTPGQLAEWTEFHERVAALPDDEREAFELIWYQGLSQSDAGEAVGVSARTIKRRWQAACLKLEAFLGGRLPPL